MKLPLWSAKNQLGGNPIETDLTLGEAVEKKSLIMKHLDTF